MEFVIIIQSFIITIILSIITYQLYSSDWVQPRKWAKIRVLVDEKRRRPAPEAPEEDDRSETQLALQWLVLGTILLLLMIITLAVYAG